MRAVLCLSVALAMFSFAYGFAPVNSFGMSTRMVSVGFYFSPSPFPSCRLCPSIQQFFGWCDLESLCPCFSSLRVRKEDPGNLIFFLLSPPIGSVFILRERFFPADIR